MNFKAKKWSDIIGNQRLKTALKNIARNHKTDPSKDGKSKLLVTGTSRSGKTESVELFTRVITCRKVDTMTMDPCDGSCEACIQMAARFGITGLYSEFWSGGVEFIPVDCGMFSNLDSLIEKLDIRELHPGRPRVYFLDEIHRLFRKKMDEALLKTVEQLDAYWFFATAKPGEIDAMFKNRLIEISTQLPTRNELAIWLQLRCVERDLDLRPVDILKICDGSNMIPGLALKKLSEIELLGD